MKNKCSNCGKKKMKLTQTLKHVKVYICSHCNMRREVTRFGKK